MSQVIAMRSGASLSPIYPQSIEEVYRLAKMALTSGMLKPLKSGYGDNAETEQPEATLARGTMIIMQGMEIGVPPMQSIQLLAMINGRITAHSEAVPGLLLAKGFNIRESWSGTEMADDWTCTIELTRPDGTKHSASFSVKDAKQAGLWDEAPTKTSYGKTKPNDSAWFRYPKRMLKARALGFAGKDFGADALRGIQIREEAEDMERVSDMRNITPGNVQLAIPDDIPAIASEVDQTPQDALVDQSGLIAKLQEDLALCSSSEERGEVAEQYAELIERFDDKHKAKATAILAAAE